MEAATATAAATDVRTWSVDELRANRRVIPAAPGVYTFLDEHQHALYVGKSIDLRSRLAHYLVANPARRKTARMVRLASCVRAERTGSEFAALLREASLVQALRPPFNQRMAAPERYVYLRVDYAHAFPSLSLTDSLDYQGRYLGPYLQRRRVAQVVEALNDAFALRTCAPIPRGEPCWRLQMRRCSGPCVEQIGAGDYGRDFLLVREAISGRAGAALRRLREKREAHAASERFEAAAAVQKRIAAIERLRAVLFASQAPACDAVVVQPALQVDAVELWGVVGGSIRASGAVRRAELPTLFDRVWAAMQRRAEQEPVAKEELDRRCIVHRWIRSKRGAETCVVTTGLDRRTAGDAVAAAASRQSDKLL